MSGLTDIASLIAELRSSFDASFALEQSIASRGSLLLLLVRSGGLVHALAMTDLVRVEACTELMPLPHQHAAFIGLAVLRGRATATYALGSLLGLAATDADHRWLLVSRLNIAVSVAGIDGYLRIPADSIQIAERQQSTVAYGDTRCPLVDLTALLQSLLVPVHRTLP